MMLFVAGLTRAEPVLETAARAELDRAVAGLRLPDAPVPYLVNYDILDGQVATSLAELGARVSHSVTPYRNLRAEVRVGDYQLDSSNFYAFGESEPVVTRGLPVEDDLRAIRREIWLATDQAYKAAVEQFSRKLAARRDKPPSEVASFVPTPPVDQAWAAPPGADGAWTEQVVTALSEVLDGHAGVEVGQAIARDWQGARLTLSTEGTRAWRPTGYSVVRVGGTARLADGTVVKDARWWVGRDRSRLPGLDEMKREVADLAAWLDGIATAPVEEDYLGPVIFQGAAAPELFSQLLEGEIVGTPPQEEDVRGTGGRESRGGARLGRRLLPAKWAIHDDPTADPALAGSYALDHEGVRPRRVDLVRDGVLVDVLMSRVPSDDRAGSTGHGRALGDERREAVPGVVTVHAPKLTSRRKMEKLALDLSKKRGRDYVIVIGRIEPPAMTEDFQVTFSGEGPPPGLTPPYEAWRLYADGHREAVRNIGFLGVDRRVLRDVVAAAAGLGPVDMLDGPAGPRRFQIGSTGGIPMTWDVPEVLVEEMELVARPGGEPRVLR